MLSLVLILVLAALALLVTALITASSLWAWVSIGASALAAVALLVDWLRRRAQQRAAVHAAGETSDEADETAAGDEPQADETVGDDAERTVATAGTADTIEGANRADGAAEEADTAERTPELAEPAARSAVTRHDPHTPPGEEDTDAADLLMVSELDHEVLVIDEQPRYHLAECGWLVDKDTIPIAVSEARELGFTPCVHCGPDAALVARARKKQKRSLGKFGRE
ncbi:MAG: hypothetical protein GEU97_04735 [Actinophytocola sp.]|nr:hypothetical protein [Actinophytocola sp.]